MVFVREGEGVVPVDERGTKSAGVVAPPRRRESDPPELVERFRAAQRAIASDKPNNTKG